MILPVSRRQLWRFSVFLMLLAAAVSYVLWALPAFLSARRPAAVFPAGRTTAGLPLQAAPASPAPASPAPAAPVPAAPAPAPPAPASPAAAPLPEGDFFAGFRLERDRARGQQREMLEALLGRTDAAAETRQAAEDQYLVLSRLMGLEAQVEGLIRARGFAGAVVYLGEDHAQVIVQATRLTDGQAAHLADLVAQVAGIPPHGIRIVPHP